MISKLADKVAVVTGGSSGIGLGIAKHFAREGARVFIVGRRQSQLDAAVATIGGDAVAIRGDISNLADLDRIFATIKEGAGRIDVLAVNSGVYEFGKLGEITEEQFDTTFNTDVRGVLFTRFPERQGDARADPETAAADLARRLHAGGAAPRGALWRWLHRPGGNPRGV